MHKDLAKRGMAVYILYAASSFNLDLRDEEMKSNVCHTPFDKLAFAACQVVMLGERDISSLS